MTEKSLGRARLLLWIAVAVIVVMGLAAGVGHITRQASQAPALPAVDLTGVDPETAAAIRKAQQGVYESPQSAKAWGRLGMVLLANDLARESQACLSRAEQLDPAEPRWPYLQSGIDHWTNAQAGDKLRRVVELCDDRPPTPRLRLAEWLLSCGRREEAEAEYNRSLAAVPGNPWARAGLARTALERGEPQTALARLEEAADPRTSVREVLPHAYHDIRAKSYQRLGDVMAADAEALALQAAAEDPEPPDPYAAELEPFAAGLQAKIKVVDRQIREGRPAPAFHVLQGLAQDYPDSEVVWVRLTRLLRAQGNFEGAENAARNAVRLAPASVEAEFFLGQVLFQEEKAAEAGGCFRRATQLEPSFAPGYLALAQCLDIEGDGPGTIAALRAAVRYAPEVAAAHLALGELLARVGQKDEAAAHLRDALRLEPDNPKARQLLEQIDGLRPLPK